MAWSLWDLPPLPTFCKSRVALIGDSAHASTPYHGQGAGQGMEDAAVLERLLGYVQDSSHIPSALCAYDAIRRPSAQRQTRLSLESAHMYTDLSNMADYQSFRKFIEKRMHSFCKSGQLIWRTTRTDNMDQGTEISKNKLSRQKLPSII